MEEGKWGISWFWPQIPFRSWSILASVWGSACFGSQGAEGEEGAGGKAVLALSKKIKCVLCQLWAVCIKHIWCQGIVTFPLTLTSFGLSRMRRPCWCPQKAETGNSNTILKWYWQMCAICIEPMSSPWFNVYKKGTNGVKHLRMF